MPFKYIMYALCTPEETKPPSQLSLFLWLFLFFLKASIQSKATQDRAKPTACTRRWGTTWNAANATVHYDRGMSRASSTSHNSTTVWKHAQWNATTLKLNKIHYRGVTTSYLRNQFVQMGCMFMKIKNNWWSINIGPQISYIYRIILIYVRWQTY